MGKTKIFKKKKESKKKRKHDSNGSSDDSDSNRLHRDDKKKKHSKKKKFRKPKRKDLSSDASSSSYGEINDILKTPPKHQKVKRILYRRKIKNIDPDIFVPLRRFAYDKEKMVQQAFLTLRRGVLERICPVELQHFSMDELKTKLINLAGTMSKERLRNYAEDEDLTHSSDSYETNTPMDQSDSDMEIVDDEEVLEQIVAEKREAEEREMEMRERLARKIIEKKFLQRKKELEIQKEKQLEEGEILSDSEVAVTEIPVPIGAAPEPPLLDYLFIPPPPPPENLNLTEKTIDESQKSQQKIILTYDEPMTNGSIENDVQIISENSTADTAVSSVNTPKNGLSWEIFDEDDLGEDPEIDLF